MQHVWTRFFLFALLILSHPAFAQGAPEKNIKVEPPSAKELRELTGTDWMGVYMLGQKAGYAKVDMSIDGNVFRITTLLALTVKAFGNTQSIKFIESKYFDVKDDILIKQDTLFEQGPQTIRVELKRKGSKAELIQYVSGEPKTKQIEPPNEHLSELLAAPLLIKRGKAKPGIGFQGKIFEAMPPYSREVGFSTKLISAKAIEVGGVPIDTYRWRTDILEQGTSLETVLNGEGRLIQTTMMKLMVLRSEPEEMAKTLESVPDVLNLSMVRTDQNLGKPNDLDSVKMKIAINDPPKALLQSNLKILSRDESQITIEINRRAIPDQINEIGLVDEKTSHYLEASPMIQSDHVEIRSVAADLIRGLTSSKSKIERILSHVHGNIRKTYRAQLSNALDVLRKPEGDCTEHTVLFVALVRAIGIPARPVMGLTYTRTSGGGFGGHAWAEVFIGGQWYAVDPTANQMSADPSHIPLATGNLEELSKISKYIGSLKIEILGSKAR